MARAIWKGTLGFGLVNVSVELLTAATADTIDLDLLDKRDHARIGYRKYNKSTGKEVAQEDIVRGYNLGDDRYVVLEDADLKAANPVATQSIEITGFVPRSDVPRIFDDRPYYVSPLKGSERAYALLRDVLADADQLAVARIVIHTRQHMAAVYAHDEALVVQLLRYAADLKSPVDAGVKSVPALPKGSATREIAMARQLVESMAMDWEPESYRDTYRDDLLKLVNARARKGGKSGSVAAGAAPQPTKVLDLVAALQKSLGGGRTAAAEKASSRTAAPASRKSAPASRRPAKKAPTRRTKGKVA